MPDRAKASPRQAALDVVLQTRLRRPDAMIGPDAWAKILGIAWDARSELGSRRETQRAIRDVLLDATRSSGADNDGTP
jgi:hypothetical protein